ncbi:MAG: rRNA methyltransferase [Myxococcales bacterium]|nr:rRNA methyltransferase [Myxococcales bacterium]MCB9648991.1 rRNA methyltransferase [Deltaproteobacteria bacterium]
MSLEQVRLVLLRTHNGKNLGAVARAMNNFGLSNLVLADLGKVDWSDVNQMAVRSAAITEAAPRVPDLAAAVAGCRYVVGTTMRRRPGQRHLTPREAAEALATHAAHGSVALVFGEERVGLTNQDLLACHDVSVIPTSPELPSLNLAQAVLLYCWELFGLLGAPVAPAAEPRAAEEDYALVEAALRGHMARSGFADPDRPRNGARELMQSLKRAGLTPHEARLWAALFKDPSGGRGA